MGSGGRFAPQFLSFIEAPEVELLGVKLTHSSRQNIFLLLPVPTIGSIQLLQSVSYVLDTLLVRSESYDVYVMSRKLDIVSGRIVYMPFLGAKVSMLTHSDKKTIVMKSIYIL